MLGQSVMKEAVVFLIAFIVALAITLGDLGLPPGRDLYNALNVPQTNYQVLGIPARTLIISIFNGLVYGFIVWLIYTIVVATKDQGHG